MTVNALQWNPHWTCFSKNYEAAAGTGTATSSCGDEAMRNLKFQLKSLQVDFASVARIDKGNYSASPVPGWAIPPIGNKRICGIHGKYDSTVLIYKHSDWNAVGKISGTTSTGCIGTNAKGVSHPFTIQAFTHVQSSQKILVVGAHYPHTKRAAVDDTLKTAIDGYKKALGSDVPVLFMADTEKEWHDTTTQKLLEKLTGSSGVSTDQAGTTPDPHGGRPLKTCCNDDNYIHEYDRVGMTGQHVTLKHRQLVFEGAKWAEIVEKSTKKSTKKKGKFHKAVFASFELKPPVPAPNPPGPKPGPAPKPPAPPVLPGSLRLGALQWNPGMAMKNAASSVPAKDLNKMLTGHDVDFANVVELDANHNMLASQDVDFANATELVANKYTPPLHYRMMTYQCPGTQGHSDSVSIIWNADRWQWEHSEQTGCMVTLTNVYTIQRFKHIASSQCLLVVAAHYPSGIAVNAVDVELVKALQGAMDPNVAVLVMADVNTAPVGHDTSAAFLQRLTGKTGVSVGDALKTCCANTVVPYSLAYDRIGLTGGFNPQPTIGELLLQPVPSWVGASTNFHKPVYVSFDLMVKPCTPTPSPRPSPTPWWPTPSPNPPTPPMPTHRGECGVTAMANYKNTFGRRCSAVESASGQCMFDFRSTEGRRCDGAFCNANGVDHDCAWCVYNREQCNKAYPGGSCYHDRPMCHAPHSQDVIV